MHNVRTLKKYARTTLEAGCLDQTCSKWSEPEANVPPPPRAIVPVLVARWNVYLRSYRSAAWRRHARLVRLDPPGCPSAPGESASGNPLCAHSKDGRFNVRISPETVRLPRDSGSVFVYACLRSDCMLHRSLLTCRRASPYWLTFPRALTNTPCSVRVSACRAQQLFDCRGSRVRLRVDCASTYLLCPPLVPRALT